MFLEFLLIVEGGVRSMFLEFLEIVEGGLFLRMPTKFVL